VSIKRKLFSHTKYQSIADAFLLALGVVSSVVFARVLGPAEYGRLNFLLWLLAVFGLIVGMGFNGTLSRYVSLYSGKGEEEKSGAIVSTVLFIELAVSALFVLILFVFRIRIAGYFNEPALASVFLVVIFSIVPSAVVNVFRFSLNGLQKIRELSILSMVLQPLSLLCNLAAVWMGYGVQGIIVMNFLLLFPRVFILYSMLKKSLSIELLRFTDRPLFQEMFRYNLSLWVIVITDEIIWQRSEIFFLQRFSSPDQIAYYSLAFGWGMRLIGFIPGILGGFLIPVMSELYGKDSHSQMNKVFFLLSKYLSVVIIPMTLGALAVARNMVYVLYGGQYLSVPVLFVPIFLSKRFISLYVGASAIIFATGRQNFIVRWGLILSIVNLVLDYFLIRAYAALGAVWATSIVHALAAVITLLYLKRSFDADIPFGFQFKVFLASLPMFFLAYFISANIYNAAGLCIAVAAGVVVYLLTARWIRIFSSEDTEVLLFLKERVPGILRPAFARYFDV